MNKPETVLIANIHKHLPPEIYREKTANPYRRGMPDVYYEAHKNLLWVEYKWFPKPTVRAVDIARHLSPNQQEWLQRAARNQIPTAVLVGCPKQAALFFDDAWREPQVIDWQPRKAIADILTSRLLPGGTNAPDNSRSTSTTSQPR